MAQDTGIDIPITTSWTDITLLAAGISGAPTIVNNRGWAQVLVEFSSSVTAPNGGGILLNPGSSISGTSAHVWVKSVVGPAIVSAGTVDALQPAVYASTTMTIGVSYNFTAYGSLRLQVDGLAGGDSIALAGSVARSGIQYPFQQIMNTQTGLITATITASGNYLILFAGGFWITASQIGAASAPVLTSSASQ